MTYELQNTLLNSTGLLEKIIGGRLRILLYKTCSPNWTGSGETCNGSRWFMGMLRMDITFLLLRVPNAEEEIEEEWSASDYKPQKISSSSHYCYPQPRLSFCCYNSPQRFCC